MPHDVFISHSSKDKVYADAVCARLESEGIRCWIAPRDILPGMSWGTAIVEAIETARLMVLVFSSHANASPQIEREVERALNKEVLIVPLRIESVLPGKNLEYFLGTPHWLDAVTPPFEQHLEYITQTVKALLQHGKSGEAVDIPHPPAPPPPAPLPPAPPRKIGPWIVGAAVIGLAVLVGLGWWLMQRAAAPARFVGTWTTTNFVGPDKIQFTLAVGKGSTYRYDVLYKESGQVRVSGGQVYLRTADGLERPAGPVAPGSNPPIPANLLAAVPSAVWPLVHRFSQTTKPLPAVNPFLLVQAGNALTPTGGQPAIWEWDAAFGEVAWQIRFVFDTDGGFTFTAHAADVGRFDAHDGKWTATSDVLQVQRRGAYSFVGDNSLVLTGSIRGVVATTEMGNTLWERLGTAPAAPTAPGPTAAGPTAAASPVAAVAAATVVASPSPTFTATPSSSPTATPPPPPIMTLDRRFLISHDSPVYASPDSSSAVVGRVRRGRYVHITGLTGNWLRVRLYNGTVGFIPDEAVE